MARHEVVQIKNGSFAVRSIDVGEVMHPGVGPRREAQELYVDQSRLVERLQTNATLTLFDIGLGAGSNARAARHAAQNAGRGELVLVSFENDLDAIHTALQHKSELAIADDDAQAIAALLTDGRHRAPHVDWQLRHGDLLAELAQLEVEPTRADIVFWDPFSPKANPSLWTIAAFTAMRLVAAPGCTLYTYSGSTRTRLALLLAGWSVGIGNAIGDKEETTAASLDARALQRPLDRAWLQKRHAASTPWPADLPSTIAAALQSLEALAQFV